MQDIARTDSHTLVVDTTKNRIYCTVTGNTLLENSTFFQDWEDARRLVSRGFTVLTDVSRIQRMSEDWVEASVQLQRMLITEGLAGTAELLSEDMAEKLQIHHISRILGKGCYAKEERFTNRKIAEAWLDRISNKMSG